MYYGFWHWFWCCAWSCCARLFWHMLLITSGQDTCIELDIAELKEADKPVTIQLVEGELTVMLGKNSSMTVDLTKALKTKERIVVKLESGVLKLYDKYHKPLKD